MVVAPISVDVNVRELGALVSKAEFFNHTQRCRVFWPYVDLHTMQSNDVEQVVSDQRNRNRCDVFAGHIRANPIADICRRDRTVKNVCDIQLPDQLAAVFDHHRKPLHLIGLAKQSTNHALDVKTVGPGRVRCLPWAQPTSMPENLRFEGFGVSHANEPNHNVTVLQLQRHAGKISRMSAASLTEQKRELRAELSARRASRAYDPDLADGIMRQLAELCTARGSKRVACYLPFGSEPDTELFVDWAMDAGIEVLLPVSRESGELDWVIFDGETETGIFGFAEAVGTAAELSTVDLVIAPALAVDTAGNRLGKGKGYYDRALSSLEVPVVAVVFDDELLESIPVESHDRPVQAVVTPGQLVVFAGLK